MGTLRFRIPEAAGFDPRFWQSAYVSTAIEGIPLPSVNVLQDDVLTIEYESEDTCKLSIPWPTFDFGPVVLTSTSLKSSLVPYSLRLELARGTIHRIRTRAFDWEHLRGLRIPASYNALMEQALDYFVHAVIDEASDSPKGDPSQLAIDKAIEASRSLARAYTSQLLQLRSQSGEKMQTLFGVQLPANGQWQAIAQGVLPACNAVSVDLGIQRITRGADQLADDDVVFEQLRWAQENNIKVIGCPLISLQKGILPAFIDETMPFDQVYRLVCTRVARMVSQFAGKVRLWDASSSLNASQDLELSDEQAFRLASGIIGAIRSVDTKTPIIFSINLPAAEYMARRTKSGHESIDPLRFARSLIQAHDRDIAGIGLDLNLNCWPYGTLPRDLIDISDLIDHWQDLEKSLLVRISAPLSSEQDRLTEFHDGLVSNWSYPGHRSIAQTLDTSQDTDPDLFGTQVAQACAANAVNTAAKLPPNGLELLQMLIAKPSVHGVIWNQASDATNHLFPNAGLFDGNSRPRPLIDCMSRLRQQYII